MIYGCYVIFDQKALTYSQPMFAVSDGSMIRSFADRVNEGGNEFSRHPEDYDLFRIGEYDDVVGVITMLKTGALPLGKATQYVLQNVVPLRKE